jgi:hypothetical protein
MPYKIKIDHPNAGDTDLFISGLGTFHNGTEATVDDAAWFRFRAANAQVNTEIQEDGLVKYDPQLGSDLEDLNLPEWLSISKVDDDGNEVKDEQSGESLDPDLEAQMQADQHEATNESAQVNVENPDPEPIGDVTGPVGTAQAGGK